MDLQIGYFIIQNIPRLMEFPAAVNAIVLTLVNALLFCTLTLVFGNRYTVCVESVSVSDKKPIF